MAHHQQQDQHAQQAMDEQSMAIHYAQYYPQGPDPHTYGAPAYQEMAYTQSMLPGPQLHNLQIGITPNPPYMPAPIYAAQEHSVGPLNATSPPSSPSMYETPLSPPLSQGSDTSGENVYISRNSSGATSPDSSRGSSLVHRTNLRYTPTPSPTSSSGRGRRGGSLSNSDGEELNVVLSHEMHQNRKEVTRRQRIEAEQRRRDELRDGYARLKNVLPLSNQKNSKVMLLERATNHIKTMSLENRQMQERLAVLEQEVARLRELHDRLALGVATTPTATGPMSPTDMRLLSPPPESHSLAEVAGGDAPDEDSSGDEGDL